MRVGTATGVYEIDSLAGCPQVCISHAAFIYPELRGKGHGKKGHENRLKKIFEELGYDCALCTVRANNEAEIAILKRYGWKKVGAFKSRQTQNEVQIWINILNPLEVKE